MNQLKDLIVRLSIEVDNRKFEKRSNKNPYEVKANVIENSKRKASTFKGLKQRKTAPGTKARTKKARKGTCCICNKEGHKANECHSRSKKNKKY